MALLKGKDYSAIDMIFLFIAAVLERESRYHSKCKEKLVYKLNLRFGQPILILQA